MIFMVMATMLATMSFQSCLDDDDDNAVNYPNALVTLKTNPADGTFFMQLDDSTTILPTNMKTSPYGNKEVRALANFKIGEGQSGHYSKSAYVNWIDSIRTKAMAPNLGDKNDATYGTDPVEIVRDWTTVAGRWLSDAALQNLFRWHEDAHCQSGQDRQAIRGEAVPQCCGRFQKQSAGWPYRFPLE